MSARASEVEDFDLFISYSRRDNADGMVTALVEHIRADFAGFSPALDLSVYFDQEDIRDLQDWQQRLRKGLERSKVMLAILSPHYFASEWCRREWETYVEWELARTYPGESIAPIFIVPRGSIEPLILPKHRRWWEDLKSRQGVEAQAWWPQGRDALHRVEVRQRLERLAEAIRARAEFGRQLSRVPRNLRPRNEHFTGRVRELQQLRDTLSRFEMVGVCAVHGIGGIGKTSLAHEYAWKFRPEYLGGQFEIDLSAVHSVAELQMRLVMLARDYLGCDIPLQMPLAEAFPRAKAAFELRSAGERILLILDNLSEEDVSLLAAHRRGEVLPSPETVHTLVTTRVGPGRLGALKTVSIDALSWSEALDLLFRFREFVRNTDDPDYQAACANEGFDGMDAASSDNDWKAALSIVNRLGRHTLGVELVAAFLGRHPAVPLRGFLAELEEHGIGVALDVAGRDERVQQLIAHPETLIGPLFDRTLRQLTSLETRILTIASLLPPDNVPLPWIEALCRADSSLDEDIKRKPFHGDPWQLALDNLHDLRLLVRPEPGSPTARIHRVVQTVVRKRSTADERKANEESLRRHADQRGMAFEETHVLTPHCWEIHVLDLFVTARRLEAARTVGRAAMSAARCCQILGDLSSARRLLDDALGSFSHLADIDALAPRDLSINLNRLGDVCWRAGDLAAARQFFQQGRDIAQRLADADPHSALAESDLRCSFGNLGDVCVELGDLTAAQQLFQQSLDIAQRLAAADPQSAVAQQDLSVSFRNLGDVCLEAWDLTAARQFFQQSRDIAQRLVDADPKSVQAQRGLSVSFERLGDVHAREGDLPAAWQFFQQSHDISQRLADADPHSALAQRDLSICISKLGDVCVLTGQPTAARQFFQQSRDILLRLAGADPYSARAQRELQVGHDRIVVIANLSGDRDGEKDALGRWLAVFDLLRARACHISAKDEQLAERHRSRLRELERVEPE